MNEAERISMARAEINTAVNRAGAKYALPPHITELILSSALSDVRAQVNIVGVIERERAREEKTKAVRRNIKKKGKEND